MVTAEISMTTADASLNDHNGGLFSAELLPEELPGRFRSPLDPHARLSPEHPLIAIQRGEAPDVAVTLIVAGGGVC